MTLTQTIIGVNTLMTNPAFFDVPTYFFIAFALFLIGALLEGEHDSIFNYQKLAFAYGTIVIVYYFVLPMAIK